MKTLARSEDKAEILRRLKTVRPDSARRFGRMSAAQMVCHLSDAFRMLTGQKQARPVHTIVHRTIVKWIALYGPFRWRAGILTRPEIDQEKGGTRPADFAGDVAQLEMLVEMIAGAPPGTFAGQVHPIFGPLSEAAWLRWGYLHMDHHLRQFGA